MLGKLLDNTYSNLLIPLYETKFYNLRIVPDNTVVKQLVEEWFRGILLTSVVKIGLGCYPVTRGGMEK
jgi:hypothetical protein